MNPTELNVYKKGFEHAALGFTEIISKHCDSMPKDKLGKMLEDLYQYCRGFDYEIGETISGSMDHYIEEKENG